MRPITARVKSIKPNSGGGYTIFGIVARGIYAKIVEEEASIKVALDPTYELARAGVQDEGKANLGLILGLSVVLVVIIAAIVMALMAPIWGSLADRYGRNRGQAVHHHG